jgi:hypothetical protein
VLPHVVAEPALRRMRAGYAAVAGGRGCRSHPPTALYCHFHSQFTIQNMQGGARTT